MNKLFNQVVSVFMACILACTGMAFKPATPARAAGAIYFVGGCIVPSCLGGSWNTGFTTLQEALATASSGDQIWVKMGTYYPDEGPGQTNNSAASTFTMKNGVEIYGGFAGTETQLSQRNVSNNLTILSGDIDKNDLVGANGYTFLGNNANHVVTASGTNTTAILDGFYIQQGDADGAGGLNSMGGGIVNDAGNATFKNLTIYSNDAFAGGGMYNRSSSPVLSNVKFIDNESSNDGGGMYNYQGSSPTLSGVFFENNIALEDGGGIFNTDNSSPIISLGMFEFNTAENGGGMYNLNGSSPSITDSFFESNTANDSGGGMYNYDHSNPVLVNVEFTHNVANDSGGGGMYNQLLSAPSLTDVSFTSNTSAFSGGGMVNNESTVTLTNVDFILNSATFSGGGIINFNGSVVNYNGGTIANNNIEEYGGGMYNEGSTVTLSGITFSDNTAVTQQAGGMYNVTSTVALTNVDFVSNTAGASGGGMVNNQSTVTFDGGIFDNNQAALSAGGMLNYQSSPTLTNIVFGSNQADTDGGGMYNNSGSSPTISNVTFIANHAINGGGMFNNDASHAILFNVTFSQNQATGTGGGMANSTSSPSLTHVTFTENGNSVFGGGMFNTANSKPKLINTIIANSTGGGDCHNSGTSLAAGSVNNLIEDSSKACGLTHGTNGNIVGADPALGAVTGSSSYYYPLLSTSPAKDAGNDTHCANAPVSHQSQNGIPRPQGSHCDIGSYESPSSLTIKSSSNQDGWVLESAQGSNAGGTLNSANTTLLLGDDAADREYRAILHFDTSSLPDTAVITNLTLKVKKSGNVVGADPFSFASLYVDMRTPAFGNSALELVDFNFAAKKVKSAVFNPNPASGWYSARFNNGGNLYVNRTGATQLRLYFSTGDNNNNIADFIRFYSGNAEAGDRPKLLITYYLP